MSEGSALLPINDAGGGPVTRIIPHGGSKMGGTVNLCKSLFGAGVLAMPHAFTQTGVVLGTVLYVVIGLIVVVVLLELMFAIGFVIVGLQNMVLLTGATRLNIALIAAPILMALSCFRWLANFSGVSLFGLVVYLGGVMGVASYHAAVDLRNHSEMYQNRSDHPIPTGQEVSAESVVLFLTTSLYSIEGICMVLPITGSLKEPDKHSYSVITWGVMLYCVLVALYSALVFEGGLGACPGTTQCIITDRLPAGTVTSVVRAALVAGLIVSHPL
eukprot:gene13016-27907_t